MKVDLVISFLMVYNSTGQNRPLQTNSSMQIPKTPFFGLLTFILTLKMKYLGNNIHKEFSPHHILFKGV
jgi:hypothetical protein